MEAESPLCNNMDDYFETMVEIVASVENEIELTGQQITDAAFCLIRWSEACLHDKTLWGSMFEENADSLAVTCTLREVPPEVRWAAWTFLSSCLDSVEAASQLFRKHGIELMKRAFKEIELAPELSAEHTGLLRIASSVFTCVDASVVSTLFDVSHGQLFYRMLRVYTGFDEWAGRFMRLINQLSDFRNDTIQSMLDASVDPLNHFMMSPFIRAYCGVIMCGIWHSGVARHFRYDDVDDDDDDDDEEGDGKKDARAIELNLLDKVVHVVKDITLSFFRTKDGQQNFFGQTKKHYDESDMVRVEGRNELICATLANLMSISHGHWPDELGVNSASAVSNFIYQVLRDAKMGNKSIPLAVGAASMLAVDSRYVSDLASRLPFENVTTILGEAPPDLQYKILVLLRCCVMKPNLIDRFFRHAKFLDILHNFVEHSRDERILTECLLIFGLVMTMGGEAFQYIKRHPLYDAVFCLDNQLINMNVGPMPRLIAQQFQDEAMA